ncbi:MAG: dihydroorotase [Deltaproteobacteria bacterium]|nr:dihydroorotase [Deltaproteobacteria bacterium]MBI3294906.1 dihydroorotase [Deltaproteobacteria bacterium]
MSLWIRNGRIIDPSQKRDIVGDVFVQSGKIEAIGPNIVVPQVPGLNTIDAKGCWVTPGWIDMHTHLREPGGTHKETIRTGSESAAAGGFTSIACMANTQPVNDNSYVTSYIYQKVSSEALINVYAIGAVTKGLQGEELAEIGSMFDAGIVGLSDDGKTLMNAYLLRKAMDYSKRFDLVIISHAEDSSLKGKGVMNEGFNSARFGLRGIPRTAEDIIVARDILVAEHTNSRLHIAHASTVGSVALIREAKRRGIQVTAEVTPHHLTLTDDAVIHYDTNTKVAPPLREKRDVDALREALSDGTIDTLASDHAPHSIEDKEVEYDLAEFGMIGMETAFPLYHKLVVEGLLSINRMIEAMTIRPATILGISKGTLKVGADADITIADPSVRYTIDKQVFRSKSRNSPFDGWEVQGRVMHTIVGGKVVYDAKAGGIQ